MLTTVVEYTML